MIWCVYALVLIYFPGVVEDYRRNLFSAGAPGICALEAATADAPVITSSISSGGFTN